MLGLLVSIGIHLGLYLKARRLVVNGFSAESYDTVVPRTFRMKRVEIDERTLEEPTPQPTTTPRPKQVSLPEEKPSAGEGAEKEILQPAKTVPVPMETVEVPEDAPGRGLGLLPDPTARTSSGADAMTDLPGVPRNAADLPEPVSVTNGGTEGAVSASVPGFSSLEDLIAGHKTLTVETPPILMPTDLLFSYDSDALRPEATESLSKLGTLIRGARGAKFRIEGHTDSFGTDPYNNALSLRRAEAVKAWLVTTMGIPASRIATAGLGKSHPLAPITGSIDEQQLNRRVEIVITKD